MQHQALIISDMSLQSDAAAGSTHLSAKCKIVFNYSYQSEQ
jgi:hypothetical protein